MDYEKKYAITQQPGDFLLMQWERGYKKVELSFNDRLIHTFTGAQVKKGMRFNDDQLGVIQLKFSEKPMGIDVIVDGYHSPGNRSHPTRELKKNAIWFWMLMAFALVGSFINGIYLGSFKVGVNLNDNPTYLDQINTLIDLGVVGIYTVSAVYIAKGKRWAYILGFSTYSLMFLLTLLVTLVLANFFAIGFMVFRIGFLVVLILGLKHVIASAKHAKYASGNSDELLDN